jgi:hypothetical protein
VKRNRRPNQLLTDFLWEGPDLRAARKLWLAEWRQLWISSMLRSLVPSISSKEAWIDWIFNMLSVITSRSSLFNVIVVRATVRFHMAHVGVFGPLLVFVRHVNQQIETRTLAVFFYDRLELLFMQIQ